MRARITDVGQYLYTPQQNVSVPREPIQQPGQQPEQAEQCKIVVLRGVKKNEGLLDWTHTYTHASLPFVSVHLYGDS